MRILALSLLLSVASAAYAQDADPIFGTPPGETQPVDGQPDPAAVPAPTASDLDGQLSPSDLTLAPGETGTVTLHLTRSVTVTRLDAAAPMSGLTLGQTLPEGDTTLTVTAPQDANGGYAVTLGFKDTDDQTITRTLTVTVQSAPVTDAPSSAPTTGSPSPHPAPAAPNASPKSPTPANPKPPPRDRTQPVQGMMHNRLDFNSPTVDVEPGAFINNACLITWPGPSTTTDYSVPVKVGRVDAGLSLTLGRDYARSGSCNDPLFAVAESARVGSTLTAEVFDPTDAANRATFSVRVVPRGSLKLTYDPMNPLPQPDRSGSKRQTRPWKVAFAPNPAVGRPGETVTVPIVVTGLRALPGGYQEGASLMFDKLLPPNLSFKMFSSQYQKAFDAGNRDINTQGYPVYMDSVQALAITIPKDAKAGSYDLQVSLTDNVFDTSATLRFTVDPTGQGNGLKDPTTWLLGPLDELLNAVTTTAPGQSCGITAGLDTGTPDKPGYTIFRPSETCAIKQMIWVRARWSKTGTTRPGQLADDPAFHFSLSRDSNAEFGGNKLLTHTHFDYEFSLDSGQTWTPAQRPR